MSSIIKPEEILFLNVKFLTTDFQTERKSLEVANIQSYLMLPISWGEFFTWFMILFGRA